MRKSINVLIIDDLEDDALLLVRELRRGGYDTDFEVVADPDAMKAALDKQEWGIVIADYVIPGFSGMAALKILQESGMDLPLIMVSGVMGEDVAVEVMKAGAYDFILKDKLTRLIPSIDRGLKDAIIRKEHKQAEKALRESEKKYRNLVDNAPVGVFKTHLNGEFFYVNKAGATMFEFDSPEEMIREGSLARFKNPKDRTAFIDNINKNGRVDNLELAVLTKTGKTRHVILSAAIEGESITVMNLDITEKKEIESRILRNQRMDSIGTLAGGIAHDLNNVLLPILLTVSILKKKYTEKQDQNFIDMIESSAKRGVDLVKQIMTFARGGVFERKIIKAEALVSGTIQIITETFPRSIEIITSLPTGLWPVIGDPTQLQQVLMNLCVNARDAMAHGGALTISVENFHLDEESVRHAGPVAGRYLILSISDTGHGIPPETRDRIFDPFFTTKETGNGTGLGLSTVITIVKAHGGFINLDSKVGNGTRFKVYLPAADIFEASNSDEDEAAPPSGNGETVLVVDDEIQILEITRVMLEKHGYKVITANNGAEAITAYLQNSEVIRIVITDIVMPVMGGEAVIKELHRLNPRLRIIAVSGLIDIGKISGEGIIHAFLPKPYPAEQLLNIMQDILPPNLPVGESVSVVEN